MSVYLCKRVYVSHKYTDISFYSGYSSHVLLKCIKRLLQVVDDIVDMLCAYTQSYSRRRDVLLGKFLWRHLRVGGSSRMYGKTLHICHIGEQRENLQMVDELPCGFLASLYLEGED